MNCLHRDNKVGKSMRMPCGRSSHVQCNPSCITAYCMLTSQSPIYVSCIPVYIFNQA